MENLVFDDGLVELNINNRGVLRFNPSDFNLYSRFYAFCNKMPEIIDGYKPMTIDTDDGDDIATIGQNLSVLETIDAQIKEELSTVFGSGNDISKIFQGVNLMARGGNGEMIITNFLNAITPYIEQGAKGYLGKEIEEIKLSRASRRGMRGT